MNEIDPKEFEIEDSFRGIKGKIKGKRRLDVNFIKGPIPLPWLVKAGSLGGKTVLVGLCLWFKDGLNHQKPFRIGEKDISKWVKVREGTALRGMQRLEKAGLVFVLREPGCKLVVTVNRGGG